MSDKSIHIVFQMLNWLFRDKHSRALGLLPVDKLILIALTSHQGIRGICPSVPTLANEVQISVRYLGTRLEFLKTVRINGKPLLEVHSFPGRPNQYLLNLSTASDAGGRGKVIHTPDPEIRTPLIYRSGTPDLQIRQITKNNKRNNRESEGAKNAPLSLFNFLPDESNRILAKDLRLNLEEEMESFKHRHKGRVSQYEFSRWLKSSYQYQSRTRVDRGNEVRCTIKEWGPGHPDYDRRLAQGLIFKRKEEEVVKGEDVPYESFAEAKARYYAQYGALTHGKNTSTDHCRRSSSG